MSGFDTPPRSPRYDDGRHHRAKLGFVLLATEQTVEDDVMRLCPGGVGVHFTRAPIPDSITVETLGAQVSALADAAALLLPDGSLDVVCYACTSGSVVMGDDVIRAEMGQGAPTSIATSLIGAVVEALRSVSARRISVATPYVEPLNHLESEYLKAHGFEVLRIRGLGIERDSDMVRITPDFLFEFARAVDHPEADAVFISCGAIRSLDIVDALERDLEKPVIVSNQAMMWHCLRLAGVNDEIMGYGRLMRLPGGARRLPDAHPRESGGVAARDRSRPDPATR